MDRERVLLDILNDGAFHSGEALAEQLGGISRAAVWKLIRALEDKGITIFAVRGRGYRLAEPIEFFEYVRIAAGLTQEAQHYVTAIEIHPCLDSTSTHLLHQAKSGAPSGTVCCAEWQLAGRGRRGRVWVSPFAANVYLSLLWRFSVGPAALSGLSLATGVAVARALRHLGVAEVGLKWPNDLVWRRLKLGGILLEFDGESNGPCCVIAGIGINVAMPPSANDAIDQPWVDLRGILGPGRISRNQLVAQVINELVSAFASFEHIGFPGISRQWQEFDQVAGQRITLNRLNDSISGIAHGVDDTGALLLDTGRGTERFLAGEISLRVDD
ncbi:MAG: bifunctional biotin--[acetyl-CoA-carboxylase] ligase/biotin operon repressor BirA [Candidatus Competibacteraceae bacterium]